MNAVVAGDLERPRRVHRFLQQLDAGFRLLQLKNDSLRRRYDALKYDVKRVEEILYDIALRTPTPAPPAAGKGAGATSAGATPTS